MVKIIYVAAALVSRPQRRCLLIGVIKSRWESTEQLCHCKIRLGMAYINCRINQPCTAVVSSDNISSPQIAVQKGRIVPIVYAPAFAVNKLQLSYIIIVSVPILFFSSDP